MAQRSGIPPWHMWGNTQRIDGIMEVTGALRQGTQGQLVKIEYRRPETWHWLFQAKLIKGPDNTPGFFSRIFVHWDLIVGIGRSAIRMVALENPQRVQGFEDYIFQWGPVVTAFPINAQLWTTQAQGTTRNFFTDTSAGDFIPIQEIVAQDIQLQVTVVGLTIDDNVAAAGQPFSIEVSAQFAPKTHIRPEWHKGGAFPGAEDGGGEMSSVAKQLEALGKSKPGEPGEQMPEEQDQYDEDDIVLEAYSDADLERSRRAVDLLDRIPARDPDGDAFVRRASSRWRRSG